MTFDLPAWAPSDPGAPPRLPATEGSRGAVVALVATGGAIAGGWAGSVAVETADGWSAAGVRLVLADGCLDAPSLHTALGVPLGEGLVDALRWGTSVGRVARRPEGRGFFLISAGTPIADGPAVLEGARWPALCAGFREAGVTLAVLVPVDDPGREAILREATGVVLLAAPGEAAEQALAGVDLPVLAVIGKELPPPVETGVGSGEAVGLAAPGPDETAGTAWVPEEVDAPAAPTDEIEAAEAAWEPELTEPATDAQGVTPLPPEPAEAEGALRPPDVRSSAPADAPAVSWDQPQEESEPFAPLAPPVPTFEEIVADAEVDGERPARNRRMGLFLGALLTVAAAVAAAAWFGYVEIPGITPRGGAATDPTGVTSAPAATLAGAPATETSPLLGFWVALGAYEDSSTARGQVLELSGKIPGVLFITAPVEIEGSVVHRVMAGPAEDSAAAVSLAGRVAEATGLDPTTWVARWTPLAYQLGEMPELEAARRRSDVLVGLGVPAYVLAVAYSDGSTRFRVYAGAYADETEASYLSGLLQERGLSSATLSDRTGRLPE
ncbi:MAG: SPOR domain-containing protein [Longimicrobiales bacterium]|nr:SPOR domain-containing protein [Longimicrobiales bacterium]